MSSGTSLGGPHVADAIAAENLTKAYGKQRGVIDLSFSVHPGEVFGYLGPNGAGKTTTIRIDFIRPTGGRVSVFGLDSRHDSIEIHRRTGYLPGERALYERLTGAEFLPHFAALRGGVDWSFVRELAERLDCDLGVRIRSLSHGNKQKVGLIQAFNGASQPGFRAGTSGPSRRARGSGAGSWELLGGRAAVARGFCVPRVSPTYNSARSPRGNDRQPDSQRS